MRLFSKNALLLFFIVFVFFTSCKEDDPLPDPDDDDTEEVVPLPASMAFFEISNNIVEAWHPVKFSNLSINAATYEWDFGNGKFSTEIAPSHTFTAPGIYDVSLSAITEDGQISIITREVRVGQRYFLGINILSFPDLNPEGANPDILIMFLPSADGTFNPERGYKSLFVKNIGKTPESALPLEFPFIEGEDIPLTNESYDFLVIAEDQSTEWGGNILGGVSFNPVTTPGFVYSNTTFQVPLNMILYKFAVSIDFMNHNENYNALFELYLTLEMP
ncbi:MAG: PKD domain-containing protein [Cyclobacteriaceae bacterium]